MGEQEAGPLRFGGWMWVLIAYLLVGIVVASWFLAIVMAPFVRDGRYVSLPSGKGELALLILVLVWFPARFALSVFTTVWFLLKRRAARWLLVVLAVETLAFPRLEPVSVMYAPEWVVAAMMLSFLGSLFAIVYVALSKRLGATLVR